MSRIFKTVKKYYDKGWYTKEDVASFVTAGLLSPAEYEQIVGEPFVPAE